MPPLKGYQNRQSCHIGYLNPLFIFVARSATPFKSSRVSEACHLSAISSSLNLKKRNYIPSKKYYAQASEYNCPTNLLTSLYNAMATLVSLLNSKIVGYLPGMDLSFVLTLRLPQGSFRQC